MSNRVWKTTTEAAVDTQYEGAVRKCMVGSLWVLIPITAANLAMLVADMMGVESASGFTPAAVTSIVLLWLAFWVSSPRDVYRAKYRVTAAKLDAVLEAKDGRWEWCEDTEDWAVHFGDPHRENDSDEEK